MPSPLPRLTLAADDSDVLAGHSYHGEAFNEGPRQAAVLMPGMARSIFPPRRNRKQPRSSSSKGIAQLHGFWYLEAERSFRQAAKEDPDLAIAYWGMAMANVNNEDRARGFIDEAMKRRDKNTAAREKLYIEAARSFLPKPRKDQDDESPQIEAEGSRAGGQRRNDAERYVADLEKILHEFPDDIEAKALMAVHFGRADRYGVKLTSRYAVNALHGRVLCRQPDASGAPLPNSPVGFAASGQCA